MPKSTMFTISTVDGRCLHAGQHHIARILVVAGVMILDACATALFPPELAEKAKSQPPFSLLRETPSAYQGATVILGGTIIKTTNRKEHTEIEVLQKPLDSDYKPLGIDVADGRFLAHCKGFLDPAIFKPARDISVAGQVEGKEERSLGELMYAYPVISCVKTKLWPSRTEAYSYRPQPSWYDWYGSPNWPIFYDTMQRRFPR